MPQSALVLGNGSSILNGDEAAEDGLDYSNVKMDHHCPWQVELPQLQWKVLKHVI